ETGSVWVRRNLYPSWYSEVVEAVEVVVSVAVVEVVVSVEEVVEEVVEGQEPTSGPGTRETASSSVWRVIVETVETVEETTIEETVEFVGRVGAHERPRSSGGGNVAGLVGVIVRRIGPRSKLREEKRKERRVIGLQPCRRSNRKGPKGDPVPKSTPFTRTLKVEHLRARGCPVEAVATYLCLSDHAHNRTGVAWPSMSRMAAILGRSVRTIQRHVHQLVRLGLVELVERRRWRGRYSSYTFRVLHFAELIRRKKGALTTGHGRPVGKSAPYRDERKRYEHPPKSPQQSKEEQRRRRRAGGYSWLFGEDGEDAAE
nr:helix-turn-helix domain-containing protein [Actinomycetota bacterium]